MTEFPLVEKRFFEIKVVSNFFYGLLYMCKLTNDYNLHVHVNFIFAKVVAMQYD